MTLTTISPSTDAYKPRLEEILNDIILISEIAELSVQSSNIASVIGIEKEEKMDQLPQEINASTSNESMSLGSRIQWSSVKFQGGSNLQTSSVGDDYLDEDDGTETGSHVTDCDGQTSEKSANYDSNSSRIPLKDLLDRWQEPVSKKDKVSTKANPMS